MADKNFRRFLFLHFEYVNSIISTVLYCLPPFIRVLFYKLYFKRIGKRVFIGNNVFFRYPHKIIIGNEVSINRGCSFYPSFHQEKAIIELGNNIRIGPSCNFFAAGHDHKFLDLPDIADKIHIEDNVWIGGGSTILKGVTVREGSIIAAGSIVTKDTEPYHIYAGIPAKLVRKRELEDQI